MICEKYFDSIDDLVEDELDGQAAARVNSHVFACAPCGERYEILKREKEIYAQYLFDAEPPSDLRANFQARLASEKEKTLRAVKTPAKVRWTNIFGFPRLSPTIAVAVLLVIFGIGYGWLKFTPNRADGGKHAAEAKSDNRLPPANNGKIEKSGTTDLPTKTENVQNNIAAPNNKFSVKPDSLRARNTFVADKKPIVAAAVKIEQKTVSASAAKNPTCVNQPNEEARLQDARMRNLEKEIAGQIERVEMLLRSFRNARTGETVETYDVEYEKAQSRRLLEKNARLRLDAEAYGITDARELLDRIEPYLLDIANLENNPAPGKVLEIRERVSSQNIIASLQIY